MEIQSDFKELLELLNAHNDVPVYFLGRKEFLANKKALGRKKDLADIKALGEE